ncbi:transcription-repair coupling factor [Bacillus litorisediminis]|uniref:transcription-repair coupling factor n=1 Tax=Bacillus litorisediminis TaxID=2922713 RepID=UPI001FAD37B5|nr:transcription-repair coupling factor [Bacillus litorisediminis]
MKGLLQHFLEQDDVGSVLEGIREGLEEQLVTGLSGSSRAILMAAVHEHIKRPLIIVTYNLLQAQKLYDDMSSLLPEEYVYLYPANDLIVADFSAASPELKAQRIETLNQMVRGNIRVLIVPIAGLRRLLPPRTIWESYQLLFQTGEDVDLDQLLQTLIQMGYTRTEMVQSPGEFSLRGGILDLYTLTEEDPIRIEFFDTEVDSIRTFSIDDQRSKEKLESIIIGPVQESLLDDVHLERMSKGLEAGRAKSLQKLKDDTVKKKLVEFIQIEKERIGQRKDEYTYRYLSLAYDDPASLLDYAPADSVVFIDEYNRIMETNQTLEKEEMEWYTSLLSEGQMIHDIFFSYSLDKILKGTHFPLLFLSLFLKQVPGFSPQNIVSFSCKPMQQFHGQMNLLKQELARWEKSGFTVLFTGATQDRVKKLERVLEDYEIDSMLLQDNSALLKGKTQIAFVPLQSGFELPMQKLAVITEEELFQKKARKTNRRQKLSNAERIKNYSELKPGDHVVHVNHGIGKYLGIETLEINGIHKDYLHIRYQGDDKLYVPIEQIDLVQKYVGSEGKEPKIYKLGGSEWKRVKKKVESSVQDIAEDLIKLYAEREASKGFAFSPDSDLQREFEATFPYQETEDQLRSINEIKRDMERERPMDRLLCGDVGYGKTEVAIRAAFKAVMDGKQVAFLVPTTILAQQHYETMRERFQDFPVQVGLMSRFRTKKQQQETIKGLKNGTIDVVVGTHRILSKDIQYHDLGLLIIDEEQRFGVTHKEKIKQLKANIDVLTLTATPIPRTLHMSMLGVRDLSVIETPPENRFPVQTYVMEYNGSLVREAIERELARDGQVYFLYNRVEDIERKAEEISMLVPEARVVYAHGKMTESELESVILSFIEGEADVLVSTTIIETGVDIPNVNTLIVHDADKMGLSQLYQLRGRVGRTNRVAYAYFTYRRDKVLTEVAEKRLQAIKEFTELGSGFKIAMRDLSIRGAGNLLGAQQHGFIDSVGFDLYSEMLREAIEERKGRDHTIEEKRSVEIDLELDAYIPDAYISDGKQKIEMYKRFRNLSTFEEIDELREEMVDRFGDYPIEVERLFTISEIKVRAGLIQLESIKQVKDSVTILVSEQGSQLINGEKLFIMTSSLGRKVGLGMEGNQLKVVLHLQGLETKEWLSLLEKIIVGMTDALKQENYVS